MDFISNNMFVVKYRKAWFALSAILLALSFYAMFAYGFNFSIDFKGGTITQVSFADERPDKEVIEAGVSGLNHGGFSVRPSGDESYIIRTKELTDVEKKELVEALGNPRVDRSNTIGPIAGEELRSKALKAIILVVIMIVLFITFAFRKVSTQTTDKNKDEVRPPSSWKYGLATVISLAHDVIIPVGIFVFLGHYAGVEIDILFVTGLLAILGYSVHDTIVVFDRVRENLRVNRERNLKEEFETTVGKSVEQTFARSINTSVTIFITLFALYMFGSTATKDFSLLLLVGVIVGTYSSIFVASPLLVTFQKTQNKVKN